MVVMPLSLALAVCFYVGRMLTRYEILFVSYIAGVRRHIFFGILLVTLCNTLVYVPLIFQWVPTRYWEAKQILVHFAREKFVQLPAGQFHYPLPDVMVFFDHKGYGPTPDAGEGTIFSGMVFAYRTEGGSQAFIHAPHAWIIDNHLQFIDGMLFGLHDNKWYRAGFGRFSLDLARLCAPKPPEVSNQLRTKQSLMKYITASELYEAMGTNNKAYVALHERFARIAWHVVLPFIAAWAMLAWGTIGRSNILISIVICGMLFLFSYINISFATTFWKHPSVALMLLYGSLALCALFVYRSYRKRNL
jgi:hypothetical protein